MHAKVCGPDGIDQKAARVRDDGERVDRIGGKFVAMEKLEIKINKAERYDEVIKDSLPECGDMEIVTKDAAMVSGRAGVMVTFRVELPDGTLKRVQSVTPMRAFRAMALALSTTYDDDGFRQNMADPLADGVITEK